MVVPFKINNLHITTGQSLYQCLQNSHTFSDCITVSLFSLLFIILWKYKPKNRLFNSFLCQSIHGSENLTNNSFFLCKLTNTYSCCHLDPCIVYFSQCCLHSSQIPRLESGGYNFIIAVNWLCSVSIQENIFICCLFSLRCKFFKKEGKFFHFIC